MGQICTQWELTIGALTSERLSFLEDEDNPHHLLCVLVVETVLEQFCFWS